MTDEQMLEIFETEITFKCPFCKSEQTNTRIFISATGRSAGLEIIRDHDGNLRWKSKTAARGRMNPEADHVRHGRVRVLCPSCARQFDPAWLTREGHMEPGNSEAVTA